jgi:hypothetical protein
LNQQPRISDESCSTSRGWPSYSTIARIWNEFRYRTLPSVRFDLSLFSVKEYAGIGDESEDLRIEYHREVCIVRTSTGPISDLAEQNRLQALAAAPRSRR